MMAGLAPVVRAPGGARVAPGGPSVIGDGRAAKPLDVRPRVRGAELRAAGRDGGRSVEPSRRRARRPADPGRGRARAAAPSDLAPFAPEPVLPAGQLGAGVPLLRQRPDAARPVRPLPQPTRGRRPPT